jgi:hypothetical protein
VRYIVLGAQWTGYTAWFLIAWAALAKLTAVTDQAITRHWRRHRRKRRLAAWRPPPAPREPDPEMPRALPVIHHHEAQ